MGKRHAFAGVVVLAAVAPGCHCGGTSSDTPPAPSASAAPLTCAAYPHPEVDGAYTVSGLATTQHRPIVVLWTVSAWTGSAEMLPAVTVFEDGLVEVVQGGEEDSVVTEGRVSDPAGLACSIAPDLAALAPRVAISNATDQPETSIAYRIGEVWRTVKIIGPMEPRVYPDDFPVEALPKPPPPAFKKHYDRLLALKPEGAHPFVRETYRVTFTDFDYARESLPWPASVSAPPALKPDQRWVGNPRSYDVGEREGTELRSLVRRRTSTQAVKLPDGTLVSMSVYLRIPDEDYLERVERCAGWDATPFGACDR